MRSLPSHYELLTRIYQRDLAAPQVLAGLKGAQAPTVPLPYIV